MKKSSIARRGLLLLAALTMAGAAQANFPEKTIRIIVPFAAGGGTDNWARAFANKLSARLGQPVIVENRAGAGTQVGAVAVAKAAADGYTLLFTTSTHIQQAALSASLPYDTVRDFAPIGQLGTTGLVLVATPQVKAKNLKEFIDEAKTAKSWSLGTYATGSAGDVYSRAFIQDHGLNVPVVAYKGESAAITDVLGGQIQGGIFSIPTVKGLVKDGRVKALGSLSTGRIASMPEVRSLADQGYGRYRSSGVWLGLFAPSATPKPVLARLTEAANAVTRDADLQREWAERDLQVEWRGPAEFQKDIEADMKTWAEMVQSLGIKPQ